MYNSLNPVLVIRGYFVKLAQVIIVPALIYLLYFLSGRLLFLAGNYYRAHIASSLVDYYNQGDYEGARSYMRLREGIFKMMTFFGYFVNFLAGGLLLTWVLLLVFWLFWG